MPPQESLSNNVNENEAGRVSLSCPTEPQNFGSLGSIETPTSIPTISCDSKNPLHKDTDGGYTNAAFLSDFPLKKLPSIDMASLTEPDLKKLPSLAVSNGGERPPVDFDDILPHIGEFGMYQIMLFFCMIPFAFFVAFVYFTQIFITILPDDYWCKVPELEHLPLENRLLLSIPIDAATGAFSRCSQYDVNFTQLLNEDILTPDPSWPIVPCKQGWDFNLSSIPYESIAAEFGWVCENATLPTIAQAIFFVGAICGGLLFGWLADRHGRVPALVACNFVGLIGGLATAGASSFAVFCACRFLVGMAFDNCFTMMYILVLEYVGPKWRTFVANMSIAIFFTMASCLLPWLAYYIADWRILCVVTSAPLALALITPWVVPESARWLVSQGKLDKALGIMKRFEKINNMRVEPQMYQDFIDTCHKAQKENESNKSYSVIDLFRSPRLRRITILLIVIWMAVSLVFDGHVRNVGSLGLDFFVTFTVACATELPADMFLTVVLDRWGRRWLAFGTMVASGMFSLLATTVPIGPASAGLAILGRFSVNISYNIGLQYAAEILPTVVRAQGVALIHIMGYVSSILAPFVVYLANVSTTLPLLILGTLGIFGGILALFLPETLDQDLPQTLQDGENFGKNQTFWTFPCCSPKIDDPEIIEKYRRRSSVLSRRSMRASIRGEVRSSMINRASLRARNSMTNIEKF